MNGQSSKAGTLHVFFPTNHREPAPGVRRALNASVPPIRKKSLTAGRTNPYKVPPGSEGSDLLCRVRPQSFAKAKILRPPVVVAAPGARVRRDEVLTVEDLWRPGSGPPHVDCHEDDRCGICSQLKSNPVFYACGHGHCYTCARVWLEEQWTCADCDAVITRKPFRIPAVESLMARLYGDWDDSRVSYEWSGLTFPVVSVANK
ncbi:hypothetical protein C8F04DRAFT_1252195 [Mycena alexandri]|uniref:RING-type domain-containing protein n=1 Tax=Mycena alexandri TaxID=1745969 RepID=A0AAD6XEE4_9AGAR|nr:hypothetical protein C8F04DRAFT_1252195 [Mycena alexandri]